MRRALAITTVIAILLIAQLATASGYVVILKNGHKIRCKGPMTVDGDTAIITLVTGTVSSYPVNQINLIETERYNQQGLGDAVEIEELAVYGDVLPTPTPRQSLCRCGTLDALERNPELKTTVAPSPTPPRPSCWSRHPIRPGAFFGKKPCGVPAGSLANTDS